jgi:hypothetical protein
MQGFCTGPNLSSEGWREHDGIAFSYGILLDLIHYVSGTMKQKVIFGYSFRTVTAKAREECHRQIPN